MILVASIPAVLAPIGCSRSSAGGEGSAAASEMLLLQRQVSALQREATLAKEQEFYLLLRPDRLALQIMYKGVLMREYPIRSLEVGYPRLFFRTRKPAEAWQDHLWTGGTFTPERIQPRMTITPPPPGAPPPEEVTIPPRIEEVIPVPPSYRIEYGDLMVIVESAVAVTDSIAPPTFRERIGNLRTWVSERAAGLRPEVIRLKVRLSHAEAAHLYRSLPAGVPLAIVASGSPPPVSG